MKRILSICICICLSMAFFWCLKVQAQVFKATDTFTEATPLILFDFDKKRNFNNLNGAWGNFDANPSDRDAYCKTKYVKDEDLHKTGYNLKISYKVESSQPAFNGIWTKLNGLNLKDFDGLCITVKGDKQAGYAPLFKVEIKNKDGKLEGIIDNITDEWKKIVLPFKEFDGDVDTFDFTNLTEFVIVFEDWRLNPKIGTIYVDDIGFITKKGVTVKFSDIFGSKPKATAK